MVNKKIMRKNARKSTRRCASKTCKTCKTVETEETEETEETVDTVETVETVKTGQYLIRTRFFSESLGILGIRYFTFFWPNVPVTV